MLLHRFKHACGPGHNPEMLQLVLTLTFFYTIYQDVLQFCFLMLNHAALVTLKGYQ